MFFPLHICVSCTHFWIIYFVHFFGDGKLQSSKLNSLILQVTFKHRLLYPLVLSFFFFSVTSRPWGLGSWAINSLTLML